VTYSHPDDRERVTELLGRPPMGPFTVVHRNKFGDPVVIENAPFLDDGTPMPTRYWLIGTNETYAVAVLEADGGVRRAEREIDDTLIAAAHERHQASREARIPEGYDGPAPSGGVGGTRRGVKCLHAHYACFLAGEDDPIGRWVHRELGFDICKLDIGDPTTTVTTDGSTVTVHTVLSDINVRLAHGSYADPAELTNIIGEITDSFDDALRRNDISRPTDVDLIISGESGSGLARLESGASSCATTTIDRDTAEELFRLLATDKAADRLDHPGLLESDGDLLGTICVVTAISRFLNPTNITLGTPAPS
jgi:uncharacterized protein